MAVYRITIGTTVKNIDAPNKHQAINHAIKDMVTVKVLTASDVGKLANAGEKFELAVSDTKEKQADLLAPKTITE